MTATTSRGLPGNPRTGRDEVSRVAGGRGWLAGEQGEGTAWRPAVDISEGVDAYRVTVEIPGIKAGEVEITMADGLLTIQGERHAARAAAGEKVHRSERGYGVFRRSLALPSSHVAADETEASVRDGVLEILVPKAADAQDTRIRVHVSQGNAVPAPRLTPEEW
ncbi:MAG TPA: Hsp20/alpha crystallin family protein [Streptosporangiaceae bacterium]|nr:Hsp20/alpha crystallin family protein [Streptosporangiaceae bacterium]